jgi:hypothetical protein
MTPMKKLVAAVTAYGMLLTSVLPAYAGSFKSGCGSCCTPQPCCQPQPCYQTVQRTVMVPTWETQTQTIQVTRCKPETKQMTYTCYKTVPVVKQIQQQYTVMVPQVQQRTVTYTVCRQEMKSMTRQCTVMVPVQQTRSGTRQVCTMVPVTMTRTVCVDQGHWETVSCCGAPVEMPAAPVPTAPAPVPQAKQSGKTPALQVSLRRSMVRGGGCCAPTCCAPCAPTCGTQQVWVPKIVQQQIPYTCMKPQISQVPYTYTVTVCQPKVQTFTEQYAVMVPEQQTKTVSCTVCVPKVESRTVDVCSYQTVPEKRTVNCTTMVPYTENQQIQVRVCKMVPKTITCQVPACCM